MILAVAPAPWSETAIVLGVIILIIVVVVVVAWQVFATKRTAISNNAATEIRTASLEAAAAQQANTELLERIAADTADLRSRVAEVERLLKDIE